jgi:hypothetical protein
LIPLASITMKLSAKTTPPSSIKPTTSESTKKLTLKPTFRATAEN